MDYKKIYLGSEEIRDMLPETYFSQNDGKLFLLVTSSCSNEKRKGNYRVMLKYKNSKKLITNNLTNVSDAGECCLLGLKEAIKSLSPNFEVNVITGIGLGFQGTINKGKSSHKDLVYDILEEANKLHLKIREIIFKGNSDSIKRVIDIEYPLSKTKANDPKEKSLDLQSYSIALREQVEKEIKKDIALNMANLRFNNETIAKVCKMNIDDVKNILNENK